MLLNLKYSITDYYIQVLFVNEDVLNVERLHTKRNLSSMGFVERKFMIIQLNEKQKEGILKQCNIIAGSREITAICLYGPRVCGYADNKTAINVLLILERFNFRLNTYHETLNSINVSILVVNKSDFERDVKKGWLGEFFAERLTVPYEPLKNPEYLQLHEVKIKKRSISELLENLILEFPESSNELLIEEEYFMHEAIMRSVKVFPPIIYSYLNMFRKNLENENQKTIMDGYIKALDELEEENIIFRSGEFIKIRPSHINAIKKKKYKLPPVLKLIQRLTLPTFLSVFSESTASFIEDQRLFPKDKQKVNANGLISRLEDPQKHILLPTTLGLVSLSDKSDISDVARKILPDGELLKFKTQKIGGVFNDIYVLTVTKDEEKQRFVVKQFLNWSNLKWLPLTVWSFGTTSFAVHGQSRLEKEYAINKLLQSKGFPVPKIFYISHKRRLIFEEFIEGKELSENIKNIIFSNHCKEDVILIKEAGRKIAQAHSYGITVGDCKPENFLVTKNGIVLLDLEQATRNGNQSWDIAEFLYFAGHYSPPMASTNAAAIITKNFIEGYLEAGGKKDTVKKAGSAKYIKVFSIFTPPHILFAMSNICQKV
jgi:tRNA A-37 threonylcarbamoyl transferase component Bud32